MEFATANRLLSSPDFLDVQLIPRIVAGATRPSTFRGAVIALGNFDGLHLGHQAVVAQAAELARARSAPLVVATFDPHPVHYFRPDGPPFQLTNIAQRHRLLQASGADALLVFEFNSALAKIDPQMFVNDWLAGAGGVVTGEDFKFGRDRKGDVNLLSALSNERGMAVATVAPVTFDNEIVSSSRVRNAVRAGNCELATQLLTRPFSVEGEVCPPNVDRSPTDLNAQFVDLGDYVRPRPGTYEVSVCNTKGKSEIGLCRIPPPPSSERLSHRIELCVDPESKPREGDIVEIALLRRVNPAHTLGGRSTGQYRTATRTLVCNMAKTNF